MRDFTSRLVLQRIPSVIPGHRVSRHHRAVSLQLSMQTHDEHDSEHAIDIETLTAALSAHDAQISSSSQTIPTPQTQQQHTPPTPHTTPTPTPASSPAPSPAPREHALISSADAVAIFPVDTTMVSRLAVPVASTSSTSTERIAIQRRPLKSMPVKPIALLPSSVLYQHQQRVLQQMQAQRAQMIQQHRMAPAVSIEPVYYAQQLPQQQTSSVTLATIDHSSVSGWQQLMSNLQANNIESPSSSSLPPLHHRHYQHHHASAVTPHC